MSNIQDIISKALAWWSKKHAASTVQCQGIYFSMLMETAECRLSYLSTRPITQFYGNKMLKNGRGQTQLTHTPKRRIYTKKQLSFHGL